MAANTGAPLVTIGMPVYNEAVFLCQALDSLLAQDFTDFEIILTDNASTDATENICRAYTEKDRRIRYYRNESNLGAVANFRRGVDLSSGKYFMWASGHDLWHPTYISKNLQGLQSNASLVLSYSQIGIIDKDGEVTEVIKEGIDTRGMGTFERFRSTLLGLHRLLVNDLIYGLIRTEQLKAIPFQSLWGWDHLLSASLSLRGSFGHIDECLYFRRKESGRTQDFPRWTDQYWERLIPGSNGKTVQMTVSQYWWAYCVLIKRSPFGGRQKYRLFIDVSRSVLHKHWMAILFHDAVCGTLRIVIGNRATNAFKRHVYQILGKVWPSRLQPQTKKLHSCIRTRR